MERRLDVQLFDRGGRTRGHDRDGLAAEQPLPGGRSARADGREGYGGVDLRAAGAQTLPAWECSGVDDPNDRCLLFAINTWGPWSNAAANEWAISIDNDRDGDEDRLILGVDDGLIFSGVENGVLDAIVIDTDTDELIAAYYAVAPTRGTTLLLAAMASDLGLSPAEPR